jgi:hypothetical protein
MDVLVDSQYFYGVDAYKNLYHASHIKIDVYENFRKMSFRNRCRIAGANGRIDLNIPVEGGRDQRRPMKDLKISYREDWQRRHWGAIFSAYGRSPWFEHYREELKNLYEKRVGFLVDWNTQTFEWANKKLGKSPGLSFTENYRKNYPSGEFLDLRNEFMPRNDARNLLQNLPKYHQVFEHKNGFLPGLSILDLLCCEGPGAAGILAKSE